MAVSSVVVLVAGTYRSQKHPHPGTAGHPGTQVRKRLVSDAPGPNGKIFHPYKVPTFEQWIPSVGSEKQPGDESMG